MDTLVALNPKLREENWVKAKGPCHLLVNAHVEICAHRLDLEPPLRTLATSSWVLSPGVPWGSKHLHTRNTPGGISPDHLKDGSAT